MPVRVRAPGKINLYLAVGRKAADGYHPLATVFQAVDLYDTITAETASTLSLEMAGIGQALPADESNLAMKAARALAREAGMEPRAHLVIDKQIPIAAGMAGGSADAAGTLIALNRLWGLRYPAARLALIGATLGADVPFCLAGGMRLGHGRGDQLGPSLGHPRQYTWLLITQGTGLATPAVFREFDSQNPQAPLHPAVPWRYLRALKEGDVTYAVMNSHNELAAPALSLHPGARAVVEACGQLGIPALVSGSGPTVAVYRETEESAASLAEYLKDQVGAAACHIARGPVKGPA